MKSIENIAEHVMNQSQLDKKSEWLAIAELLHSISGDVQQPLLSPIMSRHYT